MRGVNDIYTDNQRYAPSVPFEFVALPNDINTPAKPFDTAEELKVFLEQNPTWRKW
jgi:hypothetical protein